MNTQELLFTLQSRFDASRQRRRFQFLWSEVQNSLQEEDLQILLRLEERRGAPSLYKQDEHAFYFGELASQVPSGFEGEGRGISYQEANQWSEASGLELMSKDDYFSISDPMDERSQTQTWLLTPPEVLDRGEAYVGYQGHGSPRLVPSDELNEKRGFRCVLRVLKKGKVLHIGEKEGALLIWPTYDSYPTATPAQQEEWDELLQKALRAFVSEGGFQTQGQLENTLALTEPSASSASIVLHYAPTQRVLSARFKQGHRRFLDALEQQAQALGYAIKGSGSVYQYWQSFKSSR